MNRLYMDNAATSFPKPAAVLEAMTNYARSLGASAGRGAYAEAVETGRLIAECRQRICRLIHGERAEHVIFCLNCSDALNLAIKGLIDPAESNHAICTAMDHNSILRPLNALQQRGWLTRTCLPVDPAMQQIDPDEIRKAIRPNTRLIALTHASNVTGVVQPIRAIGRMARERGIPLIVDAAQSIGHVPIDVREDCIDLLAAPGHKALLGPLGTGFLYIRPGIEKQLRTIREGGTGSVSESDQPPDFLPDKYEPGSHNAIGLVGLSQGVQWVLNQTVEKLAEHERTLVSAFLDGTSEVGGLTVYGPAAVYNRVGVMSLRVDSMDAHELAAVLESRFGILSRAGLHCAPLAHETIGTLAVGGTTRLSFGAFTTVQDVNFAAECLSQIAGSKSVLSKPLQCPADKG
jgi:cysteine desulfurase / selenocysteine lyase